MLDALTVARAGRPVLAQVALEVPFGAVVCVEGANGSGKTSLLRVLAGLAAPAAGTVRRAVSPCAFVPERVRMAPRVSPLADCGRWSPTRCGRRPGAIPAVLVAAAAATVILAGVSSSPPGHSSGAPAEAMTGRAAVLLRYAPRPLPSRDVRGSVDTD